MDISDSSNLVTDFYRLEPLSAACGAFMVAIAFWGFFQGLRTYIRATNGIDSKNLFIQQKTPKLFTAQLLLTVGPFALFILCAVSLCTLSPISGNNLPDMIMRLGLPWISFVPAILLSESTHISWEHFCYALGSLVNPAASHVVMFNSGANILWLFFIIGGLLTAFYSSKLFAYFSYEFSDSMFQKLVTRFSTQAKKEEIPVLKGKENNHYA